MKTHKDQIPKIKSIGKDFKEQRWNCKKIIILNNIHLALDELNHIPIEDDRKVNPSNKLIKPIKTVQPSKDRGIDGDAGETSVQLKK